MLRSARPALGTQDGLVGSPRRRREQDACRWQRPATAITEVSGERRTHLAITVELVHGSHTGDLWPWPGRVLIASRSAAFEQFATAIDDAFARWDRNHLHEFTLADGTIITPHRWWDGEEPDGSLDGAKVRLGRLRLGEQFAYVFDLGDNWQHLCTVGPKLADPMDSLGTVPGRPLPCRGWGDIPDQYGRRWNGDDGSSPMPPAPGGLGDLPPILPWWGPRPSREGQASRRSGLRTGGTGQARMAVSGPTAGQPRESRSRRSCWQHGPSSAPGSRLTRCRSASLSASTAPAPPR